MKPIVTLLFFVSITTFSQEKIKIKRIDNRFLFYNISNKTDTITLNSNDVFYIKLPDSLKQNLRIYTQNGQFKPLLNKNEFKFSYINGMQYSHTIKDTLFETLLEGNCERGKIINITISNTFSGKEFFKNKFTIR